MAELYQVLPTDQDFVLNPNLKTVIKYAPLYRTKDLLNSEKHKIDPIYNDKSKEKIYSKITDDIRLLELLRGSKGILAREYNAQGVTNANMKMYEAITYINRIYPELFNTPTFRSFHIAEAPGNFLNAINHFIKTKYKNLTWEWFANSYEGEGETDYLTDTYGLIKRFRSKWLLGPEKNGDITSVDNLVDFSNTVGKVDLVTSDVKFVPREVNFDEEENINKPVQVGHLLATLLCLRVGGVMLLKEFTYFETLSVHCLLLLSKCFDKLYIYKPESSRPANSETYLLGIGFKGVDQQTIDGLKSFLTRIRNQNNSQAKPGFYEGVPKSFFEQINRHSYEIAKKQIAQIERNLQAYEKYHTYYEQGKGWMILEAFKARKEKAARTWIREFGVEKLPLDQVL